MEVLEAQWEIALSKLHDETTQREGLDALMLLSKSYLQKLLELKGSPAEEANEIFSELYLKFISRSDWSKKQIHTRQEWLSYCLRAAMNLFYDQRRQEAKVSSVEEIEISSEEQEANGLFNHLEYNELNERADDFWLGPKPDQFLLRLVAAKLALYDRLALSKVHAIIRKYSHEQIPIDLGEFFLWFSHERVLRSLCRFKLGLDPEAMLEHALRVIRQAGQSLTPVQIAVLALRFGRYENRTNVVQKLQRDYDEATLVSVMEEIERLVPLESRMVRIWTASQNCKHRDVTLGGDGLWKRLAFFYQNHGLPHQDISNWLGSAAESTSFRFKPTTLHAWLSDRRLENGFRKYVLEGGVE